MKKLTFASLIVAASLQVRAQTGIHFAPEIGGVYSSQTMKYVDPFGAGTTSKSGHKIGLRVGGVVDIGINEKMSFQPGIFFSMQGAKYDLSVNYGFGVTTGKYSTNQNELIIPLNLQFSTGAEGSGFFFGAGPYLGYVLGGKIKEEDQSSVFLGQTTALPDTSYSLKVGNDSADAIKPFNLGIGINAGYKLPSGLFARIQFQYGFLNMRPKGNSDNSIKGWNIALTFGYFFGSNNGGGGGYRFR